MMGNVAEWVADWYARDYYAAAPDRNPKGPESGI
jgi:formylglycine-generating enzyme required for sulfatase activity